MNPIKSILLTTDLSEISKAAFEPAVTLANVFGSKILLVCVGQDLLLAGHSGIDLVEIEAEQRKREREELAHFAWELIPDGIEVERFNPVGIPHLEIVRLAEAHHADLIVMATHGRGFFSHAFLGSTTERVIRRAPCPVLAVRNHSAKEK